MTLRTRTSQPSSGATSGPGRPRLSDSRLRHRRHGERARRRDAPEPAAVRRRAEALLGGSGPPGAPPVHPPDVEAAGPVVPGGESLLPGGAARRLAVRERLPVWLQVRCGVQPRTVAAVCVVLVVAVGFAAQQFWSARPQPVTAPEVVAPAPVAATAPASTVASAPAAVGAPVVVDVSGKVREPGVRRLPAGSRVEDALSAAGGVRPGTDTTGLNLARVLVDGEQVLVGAPAPPAGGAGGGGVAGGGAGGVGGPSPGPLSLGTATAEQLDRLPGVGPVLAQHIVDFRTVRGGFRSVEELRQVNGIGERRFADLRRLVRP
ncbi:helix-hairpin-helix domain-containing protein [Streptomyces sp. NPDC060028]|uniref:helix-hairpin-helix domain-containing protein n=1 Tax=Streptomyces sp. NPDC060028 TaxID=3347041 RepID=UPI00368F1A24